MLAAICATICVQSTRPALPMISIRGRPRSLHEVIAVFGRLQPAHQADFVAQLATDPNAVVVKGLEELQHARLQCGRYAATTAPTLEMLVTAF